MIKSILSLALWAMIIGMYSTSVNAQFIENGGFEDQLAHWGPISSVSLTEDAYEGRYAVELNRMTDDPRQESGLNRMYGGPGISDPGSMLTERKGAVSFWYKVPKGPQGTKPRVYLIPMSADGKEDTGAGRVFFEAPVIHFEDGQWHQAIIAYNFLDQEKCKWVQISPRLEGVAGSKFLLDEFVWHAKAGASISFATPRVEEVADSEGLLFDINLGLRNIGDEPFTGKIELSIPNGLKFHVAGNQAVHQVTGLAPKHGAFFKWRLEGLREKDASVVIMASSTNPAPIKEFRTGVKFQPFISEIWLETERAILSPGEETDIGLYVENIGSAYAELKDFRYFINEKDQPYQQGRSEALEIVNHKPFEELQTSLRPIAPGTITKVASFRVKALKQIPYVSCLVDFILPNGETRVRSVNLVIGAPPPSSLDVEQGMLDPNMRLIACQSFLIAFPKNEFGYMQGWVYSRPEGKIIGAIPWLALKQIVSFDSTAGNIMRSVPVFAERCDLVTEVRPLGANEDDKVTGLTFHLSPNVLDGCSSPTVSFAVTDSGSTQTITWSLRAHAPFTPMGGIAGPMLLAGEGAFGRHKTEALFPGVEWLEGDEYSSNDLDIDRSHKDFLRYMTHPHYVTIPLMAVRNDSTLMGMFWHPLSKWNDAVSPPTLKVDESDTDRPIAYFASPDRFNGYAAHSMGLAIPTIPLYYKKIPPRLALAFTDMFPLGENLLWPRDIASKTPMAVSWLNLTGAIYVNNHASSVLDAVDAWKQIYGFVPYHKPPHTSIQPPDLVASQDYRGQSVPEWVMNANTDGAYFPISNDAWLDELEFSAQAYLKTLWDDEVVGWYYSFGGPASATRPDAYPQYMFDSRMTAALTSNNQLKSQLQARIDQVLGKHKLTGFIGAESGFYFQGNVVQHLLYASTQDVIKALSSQEPDGGWRFHPSIPNEGIFIGMDYTELGHEAQEANGLNAINAYRLLRYARLTGSTIAHDAGIRALEYMKKFIVPRASQVWEVQVHTPDILASSDAAKAYLEGWRLTQNPEYLKLAIYWLRTGIPFIYQWEVEPYPWMRHGSIPVFGTSWRNYSWLGRPVQWNGLEWAWTALQIAEVDQSQPWLQLAMGVVISAQYQQAISGKYVALWPDSLYTLDEERSGWEFAPWQINKLVYQLMGYDMEVRIEPVLFDSQMRSALAACGRIDDVKVNASENNYNLTFVVTSAEPFTPRVLVCSVTKPASVWINDIQLLADQWKWDPTFGAVEIDSQKNGVVHYELRGVNYLAGEPLPTLIDHIDFKFDTSNAGWSLQNHLEAVGFERGAWVLNVTGVDPYMVRTNCKIDAQTVDQVLVTMSVDANANNGVQFFFTTDSSATWDEDKVINRPVINNGQVNTVSFDVASNPHWKGTITGIRLDPSTTIPKGPIRLESIQGVRNNAASIAKE